MASNLKAMSEELIKLIREHVKEHENFHSRRLEELVCIVLSRHCTKAQTARLMGRSDRLIYNLRKRLGIIIKKPKVRPIPTSVSVETMYAERVSRLSTLPEVRDFIRKCPDLIEKHGAEILIARIRKILKTEGSAFARDALNEIIEDLEVA